MDKLNQFKEKLKDVYLNEASAILNAISAPKKFVSFRINTLKSTNDTLQNIKDLMIPVFDGPFENTYYTYIEYKDKISSNKLTTDGLTYIQSFSSMTAVQNLELKPNLQLLDICAAPGGKSAYAASLVANKVNITALDNNISRINAAKANLKTLNVADVTVAKKDAAKVQYDPVYLNRFDYVIADVPCTNEGLIRDLNNFDFKFWNTKNSKNLSQLQKKIIASAIKCLTPGGTLVYSTCTYSPFENEEVIDWALKKFPDVKLFPVMTPEHAKDQNGFTKFGKSTYDKSLELTARILPDELYDGFYIAKLQKIN